MPVNARGYPVNRNAGAGAPSLPTDFQGGGRGAPANDNRSSANDNARWPGRSNVPRIALGLARATAGHALPPPVRIGLQVGWWLGNQIYDWWETLPGSGIAQSRHPGPDWTGWTIDCNIGGQSEYWNWNNSCGSRPTLTNSPQVTTARSTTPYVSGGIQHKLGVANVAPFPGSTIYTQMDVKFHAYRTWNTAAQANPHPMEAGTNWVTDPSPVPWVDPLTQVPIGRPQGVPEEPPYKVIPDRQENPYRSPREQTQRGNDVTHQPETWPLEWQVMPTPVNGVIPTDVTQPGPTFEWTEADGQVRLEPSYEYKPPGRKEFEKKKFIAIDKKWMAVRIYSAATEFKDLLKALAEAIPEADRKKYGPIRFLGIDGMSKMVWAEREKIDWSKALDNIIENEIEDRAYGAAGKANAKLARDARAPHGYQMGQKRWSRPDFSEAQSAYDAGGI